MIQAGTIRIGSATTVAVCGAYWISSISRLRKITLPGVAATSWPGRKRPSATEPPANISSAQFRKPCARLSPLLSRARSSALGLRKKLLEGETMSSHCRAMKDTTSSLWRDTPGTPRVAARHHSCVSRKLCSARSKGKARQPG